MTKLTGAENYTVCGFMTRALGLSGAELQVYAVIYSFSRDGIGAFSGSREYLAKTVGFTVRTVERALKALTDKGLVLRARHRGNDPYVYVTNTAVVREALDSLFEGRQNVQGSLRQNVAALPTKCRSCTDKMSPNNKDDNKEIIKSSSPPPTKSASAQEEKEKESDKRRTEREEKEQSADDDFDWDEDELVIKVVECPAFDHFVTAQQYRRLRELVGERLLLDYFGRLDAYMYQNRSARPHSVYKTLLKWIKEDFEMQNA